MEFQETDHGVYVPVEPIPPPAKPEREFASHELKDAEKREQASTALRALWEAMELGRGHRQIMVPDCESRAVYEMRLGAWESLGWMLLGEDAPEFEVNT